MRQCKYFNPFNADGFSKTYQNNKYGIVHFGFNDRSKAVLLLWIFYVCFVFAMPLCASVYMCLVVTCSERAGLLVIICGV